MTVGKALVELMIFTEELKFMIEFGKYLREI